jgi:putative membrane protein
VKNAVVNLVRGLLMGVAEVIPGVSGGTVALIVGIYRTLINAIADAVLALRQLVGLAPGGPSGRRFAGTVRSLPWAILIPLVIGMGVALILGAKFIEPLLETHPIQMRALFFGLVLAGVYVPAHMVIRAGGRWRTIDYTVAVIVAALMFVLVGVPPVSISDPSPFVVFIAAAVAICALVLPGVSGSFLLYTVGMYETTINAVNERDLAYLAVFALGAIVGLAVFVSVLKWLLAHRTRITLIVITGLMVGSLRALWPWEDDDRGLLAPTTDVASAILLAAIGVLIVVVLMIAERRLGLSEEQEDEAFSRGSS